MEGAVLLGVLLVGLLLSAPFVAIAALMRVRRLERRLAAIEGRLASGVAAAPAAASAAIAPPTPVVPEAAAPLAPPVASAAAAERPPVPLPAPATIAADAPREGFDWETFIAGRWLNRIGLLAVAVGVSYFLKYAIDNEWIGPRGQVAIGVLLGAGLIAWSMTFVRRGLRYFADGLAGLGAAVMYLSLWAGASYYGFIPTTVAFVAMIAVTAAMLAVALGRNSQTVAVLAMIGGFLTPWLVSTGRDSHVVLFLYLALHNSALLAIARAREWRFLELPAFTFTQLYFWGWFDRFYRDALLLRTMLFGALFFGQFSILPVIRVRRSGVLLPEQALLVPVNAAVFLLLLRELLWPDYRWSLTLLTLMLAAFHLALTRAIPERPGGASTARMLFAGVALTLVTLVVPMRLDGHWITLAWAIEAAVLAWTGFATATTYLRVGAYVIFAAVALRLLGRPLDATEFLVNARLATALVVAASAAVAVWFAGRHRDRLAPAEPLVVGALAIGANALILWALTLEIDLYFEIAPGRRAAPRDDLLARSLAISLLWTLYASALVALGVRFKAAALRWQGLALFGITTAKVFFADLGYLRGFYRIASSIALGVVLLAVSYLYQRSIAARREAAEDSR